MEKKKLFAKIKEALDKLNPQPKIGALEINDAYLRYVIIKGKKIDFFSLKFPPGVVEDGRVKDKEQFLAIAGALHGQISKRRKKKIYSIISISDANVFTTLFNLPDSAAGNLEEAAVLNLQMNSPIDFSAAYSDWQVVGEKSGAGAGQMELFGAFASKQIIDEYEGLLAKAGFGVVAVEFPALALARTVIELGEGIEKEKIYLLLRLGADGLTFGIVKNRNLYFVHFVSWQVVYGQERKVPLGAFKDILIKELQKVLNFYEAHIGGQISGILLVSPGLVEEISKIISGNFSLLPVRVPKLKQFQDLSLSWFSVLGSALRGTLPRAKDELVSIASAGTEAKFSEFEILNFSRMWRNLASAVMIFILAVFGGFYIFLANNLKETSRELLEFTIKPEASEVAELAARAEDFNRQVGLLAAAKEQTSEWSGLFDAISGSAGEKITLKKIFMQSPDSPILLAGISLDESALVGFRQKLEETGKFEKVELSFSNVKKNLNGTLDFSLSVQLAPGAI